MLLCLGCTILRKVLAFSLSFLHVWFCSGGERASPGPVVRPEEGQRRDPLPLSHAHHLCGEQPRDTQGDLGELDYWMLLLCLSTMTTTSALMDEVVGGVVDTVTNLPKVLT